MEAKLHPTKRTNGNNRHLNSAAAILVDARINSMDIALNRTNAAMTISPDHRYPSIGVK